MKKTLLSITFICYLVVSCGVIVNFHYCMNRLSSTDFYKTESKVCGKCGMHNRGLKGCCHDEIKVVKLQVDQQTAKTISPLLAIETIAIIPSTYIATSFYNNNESKFQQIHPPPLLTEQDTYLQNAVFRI